MCRLIYCKSHLPFLKKHDKYHGNIRLHDNADHFVIKTTLVVIYYNYVTKCGANNDILCQDLLS